ncbi:MAG: hypothetical protein F6K30_28750, partial [Cyanothece sp. SIO2G6]|nr:hypothetical protein [Cyanothece sp. SIO2G6]
MDYQEAIACASLCQDVYQDLKTIQLQDFAHLRPYPLEDSETDTQCIIVPEPSTQKTYIAFRGSEKRADWYINLDWQQEEFEFRQRVIEPARDQGKIYPYGGDTTQLSVEM